jgi:hypothetical protein
MAQYLMSVLDDTAALANADEMAAIEAPHLDAALRLAALGSKHCNRRIELRPFLAE